MMNPKKIIVVMGCSLMMLSVLTFHNIGGEPFSWSYHIAQLSASALSEDGERFLVGCNDGKYFVFDRYGNVVLNGDFEVPIHSVDIAENGNMIFGLENGIILADNSGKIQSREYLTEPALHTSIAKNGSYAVAGTQREIFLMSSKGLGWKSEIEVKSPLEELLGRRGTSAVDPEEISISTVAISTKGSSIAVAAQEKVFLFGLENGTYKTRIGLGFTVTSLVILPDESGVVIGTEGGTLSLYSIEGRRRFSIPQPGSPTSEALLGSISSISANSEQILVGTSQGEIYLFNQDGNNIFNRKTDGSVIACDISDDGKFMVTLNTEGTISFSNVLTESGWEFAIRNPLFARLSKDGKYVGITGGNSICFFNNWENTFESTRYFPYSSRGSFSLKDDLYSVWSYSVKDNCVFDYGDINGDGWNEVVLGSGTELVVLDHRGELIWKEESFPDSIEFVRLHDLTEDAVPEIIIGINDGKLNMEVWSGNHERLNSFNFMRRFCVNQEPGIGMGFIAALDIDQDGVIEILSEVRAGHSLKPRGIFAFEYPSGEEEWFYETAPIILNHALADINNDGDLELILGSQSSCDGNYVDSRDDAHVYVMVVDLEGNEIWAKEIGYKFMQLFVAVSDLDGDGWKEIVGTVGNLDNTIGKLSILSSNGNYVHEKEFDHSIWFGGIADFEKDGFQEIVITDSEGRVIMYDHSYIPSRQFEVGQEIISHVKGIVDLDGNGTLEIVFVTESGELIIMDSSFAELASVEFDKEPQVTVAKVSGCAIDLLVYSSDLIELYSLKLERPYICPLPEGGVLKYPELYFEEAETHYTNLKFKEAGEYYKTAKGQYEEAGNSGKVIESNEMLERTEYFCNALNKLENGKGKLMHSDFKNARYDPSEAEILVDILSEDRETRYNLFEAEIFNEIISEDEEYINAKKWLKTAKDDLLEARIFFDKLLKDEKHIEVKEWLPTQIDECESLLKVCNELENAFDSFENGKEELLRENLERAKEYFTSASEAFKKYGFDGLSQDSRRSLGDIKDLQKSEEIWARIFRWAVVLFSWIISSSIIYKALKCLQDIMYRNENYSTFESLLCTFHIRRFPKFSVIRNPYYAGKPVRDPSMFFGRKFLNEFLKNNLVSPGQNPNIILYGERKSGKTSILFQIENGKMNLGPEFIPVYIDMNKMIIKDDWEFLSHVVSAIQGIIEKSQIRMTAIPLEEKENPHLYFKDIFLRNVADSIGKKRILFLIDEYEVIERRVKKGKLSKDILSFLKSVIEPEVKLDFIFTGSKKIDDFIYFNEWSYTLGASESRKIGFLRKKDATKLIKDPVAKKIWYTNRAVEEILEFSGYHPYFLQHFCFNLVTLLNENESFTVDIKEVEEVMQDMIENPIPQMEYLWRRLSKDQQELVSFLAGIMQRKGDSVSQERIIDEFKEKDKKTPRDANMVLADLADLKEKDILRSKRDGYSFCADIFKRFVEEHYPL